MKFIPGTKVLLEWKGYSEEVEYWGKSPFVKNSIVVKGKDGVMRTESLNAMYITPISRAMK